jgi:hypothetical protein|uniref:Uncharacterized protein n=1 Tax=Tetraselmis chuii TaxID=63592 RepID=A0A7S1SPE7_9CHLO|mmetsp:Transcript_22769/g.40541  ORF Transcript_22769/g.40541 Transcript_22769/m.40541 type:complete len:109 (+) Transcript_22769:256-582(+)
MSGNARDGEPLGPEHRGVYFFFRQTIGLVFACAGIAFTICCFEKYYYGLSNLAVCWIGLLMATVGLVLHEFRPYKAWDDWTLLKGWFNLENEEPGAIAAGGAEGKKKK